MNERHEDGCQCSLCLLRELDQKTDWEQSGDVLSVNDPEDGDAGVAVLPTGGPGKDGSGDGLATGERAEDILSCALDMVGKGDVSDVLTIVNSKDDEQFLFTTIGRNDLIMGTLMTAMLNWFNTQLNRQSDSGDEYEAVV